MKKKGLLIFLVGMVCTYTFATTPTYLTSPKNQASFTSNQTFKWISNEQIKTHELKIYNCDYDVGANAQSLNLNDYEYNISRDIYNNNVPLAVSGLACAIENRFPLVSCNSGSVELHGFGISGIFSNFNEIAGLPSTAFGGITHLSNEYYVLAESTQNYIYYIPYSPNSSTLIGPNDAVGYKLNLGAGNGIQGITYNPINNKIYVAQEKSPITLHEVSAFSEPNFTGNISLKVPFNMAIAASIWGIKSVNGLFHLSQDTDLNGTKTGEHLLVLSAESNVVIECDMNGKEISRLYFGNKIVEASGIAYYNGSVYITEKSDLSKGRRAKLHWFINKSHQKATVDLGTSVFSKKGIYGESYSSVSSSTFSNGKTYCWEIIGTDNEGEAVKSTTFSFKKGSSLILGCTDPNACNYNPSATQNNGSCEYNSCNEVISSISSPYAGQKFYPGNTINIKWVDNFSGNVTIKLKAGNDETIVSYSTNSDGSYSYKIPNYIKPASNYRVVIQKFGDASVEKYSAFFTINGFSINITSPKNQESFNEGENVYVKWDHNLTGTFNVSLYKGSNFISTLTYGTSNSEYTYKVPTTITAGNDYRFLVKSNSSTTSVSTYSPYIKFIKDDDDGGGDEPKITVTNPQQNTQLNLGQLVTIKWEDNIDEPVDIFLFKGNYNNNIFKQDIAKNVSGNTYLHRFENLDQANDYNILVRSTKNTNVNDFGPFFTLLETDIKVKSPYAGNVYKNRNYISVRWEDVSSTNVSIEIYENNTPIFMVNKLVPNNGSYDFQAPNIRSSSNYNIVVTSLDNPTKKGKSGTFTIKPYDGISNITMYNGSLGSNKKYVNQDEFLITWNDQITGDVFMQVHKDDQWINGIPGGYTKSDGIEKITLPNSNLPIGDNYRIKIISDNDRKIYSFSQPFSVVGGNGNRTIQFQDDNELGLLNIYPNPTKGLVSIDVPLLFEDRSEIQLSVFNSLGHAILKKNYFEISNDKIDINLINEAKGLYFIKLSDNQLNYKAKIVLD